MPAGGFWRSKAATVMAASAPLAQALIEALDEPALDALAELLAPRLAARFSAPAGASPWLDASGAAEDLAPRGAVFMTWCSSASSRRGVIGAGCCSAAMTSTATWRRHETRIRGRHRWMQPAGN